MTASTGENEIITVTATEPELTKSGLPDLETACPHCHGAEKVAREGWNESFRVECPECDGSGVVLTESGDKVFDLMRRYFGPMLRAAIERGSSR